METSNRKQFKKVFDQKFKEDMKKMEQQKMSQIKEMLQIKKQRIIDQMKSFIGYFTANRSKEEFMKMIKKYIKFPVKELRQLYETEKCLIIDDINKLEQFGEEIRYLQEQKQQFKIWVNFNYIVEFGS